VNVTGWRTSKYPTLDVPPPGAGDTTVMAAVWGTARSAAEIVAKSSALFANVVVRALPSQSIVEP
jgi:hypothetical protein